MNKVLVKRDKSARNNNQNSNNNKLNEADIVQVCSNLRSAKSIPKEMDIEFIQKKLEKIEKICHQYEFKCLNEFFQNQCQLLETQPKTAVVYDIKPIDENSQEMTSSSRSIIDGKQEIQSYYCPPQDNRSQINQNSLKTYGILLKGSLFIQKTNGLDEYRRMTLGECSLITQATLKSGSDGCIIGIFSSSQVSELSEIVLKEEEEKARIRKILNRLAIFAKCSSRQIHNLAVNSKILTIQRHNTVYSQSEKPTGLYILLQGELLVSCQPHLISESPIPVPQKIQGINSNGSVSPQENKSFVKNNSLNKNSNGQQLERQGNNFTKSQQQADRKSINSSFDRLSPNKVAHIINKQSSLNKREQSRESKRTTDGTNMIINVNDSNNDLRQVQELNEFNTSQDNENNLNNRSRLLLNSSSQKLKPHSNSLENKKVSLLSQGSLVGLEDILLKKSLHSSTVCGYSHIAEILFVKLDEGEIFSYIDKDEEIDMLKMVSYQIDLRSNRAELNPKIDDIKRDSNIKSRKSSTKRSDSPYMEGSIIKGHKAFSKVYDNRNLKLLRCTTPESQIIDENDEFKRLLKIEKDRNVSRMEDNRNSPRKEEGEQQQQKEQYNKQQRQLASSGLFDRGRKTRMFEKWAENGRLQDQSRPISQEYHSQIDQTKMVLNNIEYHNEKNLRTNSKQSQRMSQSARATMSLLKWDNSSSITTNHRNHQQIDITGYSIEEQQKQQYNTNKTRSTSNSSAKILKYSNKFIQSKHSSPLILGQLDNIIQQDKQLDLQLPKSQKNNNSPFITQNDQTPRNYQLNNTIRAASVSAKYSHSSNSPVKESDGFKNQEILLQNQYHEKPRKRHISMKKMTLTQKNNDSNVLEGDTEDMGLQVALKYQLFNQLTQNDPVFNSTTNDFFYLHHNNNNHGNNNSQNTTTDKTTIHDDSYLVNTKYAGEQNAPSSFILFDYYKKRKLNYFKKINALYADMTEEDKQKKKMGLVQPLHVANSSAVKNSKRKLKTSRRNFIQPIMYSPNQFKLKDKQQLTRLHEKNNNHNNVTDIKWEHSQEYLDRIHGDNDKVDNHHESEG